MQQFSARLRRATGADFQPSRAYKFCDVKPAFGHVLEQEIAAYANWGYGDLDVIYGDLRRFYTDELLSTYACISSHAHILAGHLAVFENSPRTRGAYRRRLEWKAAFENGENTSYDEGGFGKVFMPRGGILQYPFKIRPALFIEQHSTVDSELPWLDGQPIHPQRWTWRQGHLTNDRDGDREFLYLHFMYWQRSRFNAAADPVQIDWETMADDGLTVTPDGFRRGS